MRNYDVRRAVYADIPEVEQIYAYARAFMKEHGNPTQWGTKHPTREKILTDIQKEQLYVVFSHERICGVFDLKRV